MAASDAVSFLESVDLRNNRSSLNIAQYPNLMILRSSAQIIGMQTIIRDHTCPRDKFIFFANRLIRLLIEDALSLLPVTRKVVTTPTGETYDGVSWNVKLCGVSIVRAGESMENGLREVLKDVKIGKILIQRDEHTAQPTLYFAKLPTDIAERWVLLLDPMLATGGSCVKAIEVLLEHGVKEERIIFVNLIAAPEGVVALTQRFPQIKILTTALDEKLNHQKYILPGIGDFGDLYYAKFQQQVSTNMSLNQALVLSAALYSTIPEHELDVFSAAALGHVERLKHLVEEKSGADLVSSVDPFGLTPMSYAVFNNEKSTAIWLYEHGARPDVMCTHLAAMQGHIRMLKFLLEEVPSRTGVTASDILKIADQFGRTPLFTAVIHNRPVVAAYLLNLGADPKTEDSQGRTVLHWAAFYGVSQVLGILCQHARRESVNTKDRSGFTPLHLAAMKGHGDICSTLLQCGGDLAGKDNLDRTPLEVATEQGHQPIVVLLRHIQEQRDQETVAKTNRRKMMKKRLGSGSMFVYGQYLCNLYCHYVIFFFLLAQYPSTFFLFTGVFFYIVENYCYYRAAKGDPGYLPAPNRMNDDDLDHNSNTGSNNSVLQPSPPPLPIADANTQVKLCETCNIFRPIRSKHCSVCDRCVQRFDHHCVWIGNCVGRGNHHWFFGYLLFFSLDILQLWVHSYLFVSNEETAPSGWAFIWWMISEQSNITMVLAISTVFGVMVEGLFATHLMYVFVNLTTNEAMNFRRYEYFRHPQTLRLYNPFNRGVFNNIKDFFQLSGSTDYAKLFVIPTIEDKPQHGHSHGGAPCHGHGSGPAASGPRNVYQMV